MAVTRATVRWGAPETLHAKTQACLRELVREAVGDELARLTTGTCIASGAD
jgi:hypothetical protein